jgi:hypothetical protein
VRGSPGPLGRHLFRLRQPAEHPSPKLIWNASASMPISLYAVQLAGVLHVSELVVIRPPEPLASFLADRGYLPKGVPLLLARPCPSRADRLACRAHHCHGRRARGRSARPAVARLAALPRHRARPNLRDEFAVRGLFRRPLLWAASGLPHLRTRRSSLDSRRGLTLPPTGSRHAAPLANSSSFPAIRSSLVRRPSATRRLRYRAVACVGIVVLVTLGPHPAVARAASATVSHAAGIDDPFALFIAEASHRFGVPASWIRAVIQAESQGDVRPCRRKARWG